MSKIIELSQFDQGSDLTPHEYLKSLLNRYHIQEQDILAMKKHRKNIQEVFQGTFQSLIDTFYYAGSYAKGTGINIKYDLDICLYFTKTSFKTLQQMYFEVFDFLSENYKCEPHNVAIKLQIGNKNIDVVPARKFNDENDANLYRYNTKDYIQTNIPYHINYVKNSGCRPIIKLMKIWKYYNRLEINSFTLELLTIEALDGFKSNNYAVKFLHVLEYIRDNIRDIDIVDPANHQNVVSEKLSGFDRNRLESFSNSGINSYQWNQVIR